MKGISMNQASVSLLFIVLGGFIRVLASSDESVVGDRLRAESSIRSLDSLVKSLMECRKIPGLVLAVVGKQKDILSREYGYANIDYSVPMTQHTRHCIASCTKGFSSILLGKMLRNTRYSWDTPVSLILPHCCQFSDQYRTQHVTIRDILSHRTGIEHHYDPLWYSGIFNRTELLKRIRMMPSRNKFRSNAIYNNIIYSLAGSIIETIGGEGEGEEGGGGGGKGREERVEGVGRGKGIGGGGGLDREIGRLEEGRVRGVAGVGREERVEGVGRWEVERGGERTGGGGGGAEWRRMSWEDELRMRILEPLEMFNTSFYHRRREPEQFATPYDLSRGRVFEIDSEPGLVQGAEAIASSIAVCTTSSDIALWMKCLLSALISDDCKVVGQDIVKSVMEEQVLAGNMFHSYIQRPRAPVSLIVDAYGMGWFTGYYRDRRLALHYGSLPGAYSLLALIPDLELGVFLTYNGAIQNDPYTINALLLTHVIDTALGLPSWISDACNFPSSAHFRTRDPPPPHPNASEFSRTRHRVSAYVGVYGHPVLGEVKVRHVQRHLRLSYGLIDSDLLPRNSSVWDDMEQFLAIPLRFGWVLMLDLFPVRFSRMEPEQETRVFRHVTVSFLNDGPDTTFVRVRQGHELHTDQSGFSTASPSALRRDCLSGWRPLASVLGMLLLRL